MVAMLNQVPLHINTNKAMPNLKKKESSAKLDAVNGSTNHEVATPCLAKRCHPLSLSTKTLL